MIKPQPYILKNSIQHYEWGTKGKNAFISKLLNIKSEKVKPYAELWMGDHPKAPSRIVINGKELTIDEIIRQYPKEMVFLRLRNCLMNFPSRMYSMPVRVSVLLPLNVPYRD